MKGWGSRGGQQESYLRTCSKCFGKDYTGERGRDETREKGLTKTQRIVSRHVGRFRIIYKETILVIRRNMDDGTKSQNESLRVVRRVRRGRETEGVNSSCVSILPVSPQTSTVKRILTTTTRDPDSYNNYNWKIPG